MTFYKLGMYNKQVLMRVKLKYHFTDDEVQTRYVLQVNNKNKIGNTLLYKSWNVLTNFPECFPLQI